ncbi:MAG: hypothetical protein M0T70_03100 [Geobacteraceae bacterium]|nr:hypothetical protein [Geobacteraceae bacterium]
MAGKRFLVFNVLVVIIFVPLKHVFEGNCSFLARFDFCHDGYYCGNVSLLFKMIDDGFNFRKVEAVAPESAEFYVGG